MFVLATMIDEIQEYIQAWSFRRRVCLVCVIFYFLYRYMRPEGPWQRLAAAWKQRRLVA